MRNQGLNRQSSEHLWLAALVPQKTKDVECTRKSHFARRSHSECPETTLLTFTNSTRLFSLKLSHKERHQKPSTSLMGGLPFFCFRESCYSSLGCFSKNTNRLGGFNNKHLLFWRRGRPRCWQIWCLVKSTCPGLEVASFLLCPHMMAGVREQPEAPFYKGTNSTTRAPPS